MAGKLLIPIDGYCPRDRVAPRLRRIRVAADFLFDLIHRERQLFEGT